MRRISSLVLIVMIHSGYQGLAMSSEDFNNEIEKVLQSQYKEHLVTLNQTQLTEAAIDFENQFRNSPQKTLTFFPMKLKPKPFLRPKTKVAKNQKTSTPSQTNEVLLYKEQM